MPKKVGRSEVNISVKLMFQLALEWTSFFGGTASGLLLAATFLFLYRRVGKRKPFSSESAIVGRAFPDDDIEELDKRYSDRNAPLDLMNEQFVRNIQFFGEEKQKLVQEAFVIVVGLGGVGSHCAVSLCRSGIAKIRLIDFDRVSLSSLNRHAVATRADVGIPKVECIRSFILSFLPQAQIDALECMFEGSKAEELLSVPSSHTGKVFIVDCADNVTSKIDLIVYCKRNNIPFISSCGAGAKADPTRIHIDDIRDTREDELARTIRSRLRKFGIHEGVPVCYSIERTPRRLLPLHDFQKQNISNYRTLEKFRIRIVPVIAPLPAIFGQAMASYVLTQLADQPFGNNELQTYHEENKSDDNQMWSKHFVIKQLKRSNYKRLFAQLKHWVLQPRLRGAANFGPCSVQLELGYRATSKLFCDVYRARSIISGRQGSLGDLQLVPWRFTRQEVVSAVKPVNMVCMSSQEARIHMTNGPTAAWDEATIKRVEEFLELAVSEQFASRLEADSSSGIET